MANSVSYTKSLAAADDDGVCASQSIGAAGNLTINGALASGGIATLDTARRVLLTFASDESANTFRVYGLNAANGNPIFEDVAGTAPGTAPTLQDFYSVTRVAVSGATAGNVKVGTDGVGSTPWVLINDHITPVHVALGVTLNSGAANWSIEETDDPPQGVAPNFGNLPWQSPSIPVAVPDPVLQGMTVSAFGSIDEPRRAWRLTINSGSGSVTARGTQAGVIN